MTYTIWCTSCSGPNSNWFVSHNQIIFLKGIKLIPKLQNWIYIANCLNQNEHLNGQIICGIAKELMFQNASEFDTNLSFIIQISEDYLLRSSVKFNFSHVLHKFGCFCLFVQPSMIYLLARHSERLVVLVRRMNLMSMTSKCL